MERTSPLTGDLLDDYNSNKQMYGLSKLCYLFDADFDFNDLETYMADDDTELQSYAVDEAERRVYLLTKDAQLLEVHFTKNFSIEKEVKRLGKVEQATGSTKNSLNLYLGKTLYLLNERGLFELRLKKEIEAVPVKGYFEVALPRRVRWLSNGLLAVRNDAVSLYKFVDTDDLALVTQVQTYAGQPLAASDADLQDDMLWVLDEIFGLYQYQKKTDTFEPVNSYAVRFGKKLQLVVAPHCFQVTFELNKDTFVAEMYLKDGQLHLNRFYDQIDGVREVLMLKELMIILGETEMMALWHSVSQQKLLDMDWQNKKFLNGFGVLNVHVLRSLSTKSTEVLAVFSVDGFQLLTLDKNFTTVRCDLKPSEYANETALLGSHSVVIEFNSSTCDTNNHMINAGGFCRTVHSFNFQVAKPTEKKVSILISIGLFVVSFAVAIVLVVISFKYAHLLLQLPQDQAGRPQQDARSAAPQAGRVRTVAQHR